jgi:hypothetical protein
LRSDGPIPQRVPQQATLTGVRRLSSLGRVANGYQAGRGVSTEQAVHLGEPARGLVDQRSDPAAPTGRVISGVPLYTSPSIGDDIVWGVPAAHSLVVIRSDASVVTDASVYFSSDQLAVRATIRVGIGCSYPASVVKIATTP